MSETQTKKVIHLTHEEAKAVAIEQGLEVEGKDRPTLIKELCAATSVGPEVVVPSLGGASDDVEVAPTNGLSGKRLKVNFPRQAGFDGNDDITACLNGRRYQWKREVDIELPVEVLDMLDTLIVDEPRQEGKTTVMYSRKRFPYTVVR